MTLSSDAGNVLILEILAIQFASSDICILNFNEIFMNNPEFIGKSFKKKVNFDYLFNGFHKNEITCVDVCLHQSILVTASRLDSTIRIWDYRTLKCVLAKKFKNEYDVIEKDGTLFCLSLHPSGYYLAIGFIDQIRIFYILQDGFHLFAELPYKYCH